MYGAASHVAKVVVAATRMLMLTLVAFLNVFYAAVRHVSLPDSVFKGGGLEQDRMCVDQLLGGVDVLIR